MDQSQSNLQLHQHQQPQDVLAEARKNLQALIDSGLSRDLLHQLVDDGVSLQPNAPFGNQGHSSLNSPSQQTALGQTSCEASPSCFSPLIPPVPQCPPPPIPQPVQQQQQPTPPESHQHPIMSPVTASSPLGDIKSEASTNDETSGRSLF